MKQPLSLLWLIVAAALATPAAVFAQPAQDIAALQTAFASARDAEDNRAALQALDALGPLIEAAHGRQSAEMAEHLSYRANTLQSLGRLDEAETTGLDAVSIALSVIPADPPAIADAMNTLAAIYLGDTGRGPEVRTVRAREAERLLDQAVRLISDQPQGDPDTLDVLSANLAVALLIQGRQDEAIERLEALRDARAAAFGDDDPLSLTLSNNLGPLYFRAGRYEDGEAVLARVVDLRRADPNVAPAALALSLSTLGRNALLPETAEAALGEAAALYLAIGCPDAEARRTAGTAAGYGAYRWAGTGAACPGDLRLALTISGQGGLAYVHRNRLDQPYAAVRLLAQAGDLVIGATRARYSSNAEARRDFGRYRLTHREFVSSAWLAAMGD
ncbi:MAG: tetratricopeptide repeat protein [Alphaproteobacteria bacterium]|nr:tetratricopeptide repeat protein [Alphaproteobacteria bacterium]MBU2379317.1 tetratricopeptide repeat protein [Alphaproteobacteria bacterium]